MIKAGDRIEWDNEAHIHTAQMDIKNTGIIDRILPINAEHIDHCVTECALDAIHLLFIRVDDSRARIILSGRGKDLKFPDGGTETVQAKELDDWEDDLFD